VSADKLPWTDLLRRTVRATIDDDCLNLSAQLSYYLCLGFFPALLFLLALSSFFSLGNFTDNVSSALGPFVSSEMLALIEDQMRRLGQTNDGGLLTVGVLGAIWGSSSAVTAIVTAVNRAYDLPETRPWWRIRLIAISLTVLLALGAVLATAFIMAGPGVLQRLGIAGDSNSWNLLWNLARWPVAFVLIAFAVGVVYHYAPDADQDWVWVTPGAVVATALWLLSSMALKIYVTLFADYEASYGAVGGIVVLLLWLYTSGLGILIGAELNAEIEHAMPHGRAPVLDTESGRRVLGQRAARLFERSSDAQEPVTAVRDHDDEGASWSTIPGAAFALLVLGLRGPKRVWRGHP